MAGTFTSSVAHSVILRPSPLSSSLAMVSILSFPTHQIWVSFAFSSSKAKEMAPKQPTSGLFVGSNKGHVVTRKELAPRPSSHKGEATPFLVGLVVAAAALAGKYGIQAWQAFKMSPPKPKIRRFYDGGFQSTMIRREAALILGVREHARPDKVKEAHRKVMVANHPDAGGSHYLASKINEAKDVMLKKTKGGGSAF